MEVIKSNIYILKKVQNPLPDSTAEAFLQFLTAFLFFFPTLEFGSFE